MLDFVGGRVVIICVLVLEPVHTSVVELKVRLLQEGLLSRTISKNWVRFAWPGTYWRIN